MVHCEFQVSNRDLKSDSAEPAETASDMGFAVTKIAANGQLSGFTVSVSGQRIPAVRWIVLEIATLDFHQISAKVRRSSTQQYFAWRSATQQELVPGLLPRFERHNCPVRSCAVFQAQRRELVECICLICIGRDYRTCLIKERIVSVRMFPVDVEACQRVRGTVHDSRRLQISQTHQWEEEKHIQR